MVIHNYASCNTHRFFVIENDQLSTFGVLYRVDFKQYIVKNTNLFGKKSTKQEKSS